MAENDSGRYWDPLVMQQELSPVEKQLRDTFVTEYLKDYNAWAAAVRTGYLNTVAVDMARFLMSDPYVQKEITRRQSAIPENPREVEKKQRQLVKEWLIEEARYKGPDSTHGGRVSALKTLCNILEMEGATKIKSEVTHRGGIMVVPGVASVSDWEKAAQASQDKLVQDARH